MLRQAIVPLAALYLLAPVTTARAVDPAPMAAWPGVFPEIMGYARSFDKPVLTDRTKGQGTQKAVYQWTGGSIRHLELTIGASAKFQEAPKGAEKVTIGKTAAWYSEKMKDNMFAFTLLVPLGDGKGMMFEGHGLLSKEQVLRMAGKIDLARLRAALATPPRTDFRRSVEPFRAATKEMSYRELTTWVGEADADIGSGIHVMVWKLPDGGRVLAGTPDFMKVLYLKHESKDGKKEDLLK